MKRQFNVFDGLFLIALVFKLRNLDPVPAWWEVFAPYLFEALTILIGTLLTAFSFKERSKFWLYEIVMKIRVKQAAKQARRFMKQKTAEGRAKANSNPGQYMDPQNTGK